MGGPTINTNSSPYTNFNLGTCVDSKASIEGSKQISSSKGSPEGSNKPDSKTPASSSAYAKANISVYNKDIFDPVTKSAGLETTTGQKDLVGGIKGEAYAKGPSFSMNGNAYANVNLLKGQVEVGVKVDIKATLAEAGTKATKTFYAQNGNDVYKVELSLEALAKIGADGVVDLKLSIGKDGVNIQAKADAFAGAKASLTGGIKVSYNNLELVSGKIGIEFRAGAGAGASAKASYKNGILDFQAKAYATVGLGMGVTIEGKVNAGNIVKTVNHVAGDSIKATANKILDGMSSWAQTQSASSGSYYGGWY